MQANEKVLRAPDLASVVATWILVVCVILTIGLQISRLRSPPVRTTRQIAFEPRWERYLAGGTEIRDSSASTTLLVFSDYECVYCARLFATLDSLRSNGVKFRIVYRHLPNGQHRFALFAAKASACAAQQGSFDRMNSTLLQRQSTFGLEPWWTTAKLAGVKDSSEFESCLKRIDLAGQIFADSVAATELEISGTPTLFIEGVRVDGAPPANIILKYMDKREREKLRVARGYSASE